MSRRAHHDPQKIALSPDSAVESGDYIEFLRSSPGALEELVADYYRLRANQHRHIPAGADASIREDGVHKAHRRTQAFVEMSADWRWELDANLCFSFVCDGLCDALGQSAQALCGRPFQDIADQLFDAALDSHLSDLAAQRPFQNISFSIKCPGDYVRHFNARGRPIYDAAGTFEGYVCAARDDSVLFERQRSMDCVLSNIDCGVVLMDTEFRVEFVNDTFLEFWGFGRDEIKAQATLLDLMTLAREKKRYHEGLQDDESWKAYLQDRLSSARTANGTRHLTTMANGNVYSSAIHAIGDLRLVTFYDVTELKKTVADLREAKQQALAERRRLRDAIETLDDGFVLYDQEDRLITCNEAYRQLIGDGAVHLIEGTTYEEQALAITKFGLVPGIEGKEEEFVRGLLEKRYSETGMEKVFQANDGRWIRQRDKRTPSGNFVGLRTDITELQERQAELELAREQAETADQAKSEFLANMSHEIRTPMNGVLGMAELLLHSDLSDRQQMLTQTIVRSGSLLLTIINEILDYSKIHAGQVDLIDAPFSLSETIQDVVAPLSSQAVEKDLELIVRIDPALPDALIGDRDRIRQILTNLVGNALKFTDDGQVVIDVAADAIGADQADLHIQIRDTGIGIPEEHRDQIFRKFSQVDGSFVRKHEGTGLGLAIATSLVDLMQGEIGVESVLGDGSNFWIKLSLPIDHGTLRTRAAPVDVTGSRVMIIDDNETNCAILAEQMIAWHLDHLVARNGVNGLDALAAAASAGAPVDLVILDHQMPGMNGLEVLRTIRRDPALQSLPVIMLTSVGLSEACLTEDGITADAHLTKPAESSKLLDTIIDVISTARSTEAAAQAAGIAPSGDEPRSGTIELNSEDADANPAATGNVDILVAEDNHINQAVYTQFLGNLGYSFVVANNGQEAVSLWQQHAPSLILMDVSMPEMDGYEATRTIRRTETEQGHKVPIVGVTAHAMDNARQACLDAGMDGYLSKPMTITALSDVIVKHGGRRIRARAARR